MKTLNGKALKVGVIGLAAVMASTLASYSIAGNDSHDGKGRDQEMREGHGPMKPMDMFSERMLERMAADLKFDDVTKEKAAQLFASAREERKAMMEGLRDLRDPMRDLKPSDKDYIQQVTEIATKRSDFMIKLDVQQAQTRQKLYSLLNDEQIKMLETFAEKDHKGGKHQ